MVVFFQVVLVQKKLLVQLEDGQKKEMSSSLLQFLCLKGGVEMDDPKSSLPKREKGGFLIIDGDPEVE